MEAQRETCLFCAIPPARIILEDELSYAILDGFAVTPLHSLIIPKRHVRDLFGLNLPELSSIQNLLVKMRDKITSDDAAVTGFNIGVNCGEPAGQTIFHCHVHLIPRRLGDVANPRGGVRNIIPGKGDY